MADNDTTYQPATATGNVPIASDDVAGVRYQRVKVDFGADGSATDVAAGAGLPVAGSFAEYTANVTATGVSIGPIDVSAYQSFSLQMVGGSTSNNFVVEGSNDNVNWYTAWWMNASSSNAAVFSDVGSTTNSFSPIIGPLLHRYFRVRCSSYVSGTTVLTLEVFSRPLVTPVIATPNGVSISVGQAINTDTQFPSSSQGSLGVFPYWFNNSSWERQRTANAAAGTTGTGVPASGNMYFDGTNWQRVALATPMPISAPSNTATLTNVTSSATSVVLLSSNTARKGAIIYNDSTSVLYVKFGATASATSFTYYIGAGQHLELPTITYTGEIDGIWASANGFARVTELT